MIAMKILLAIDGSECSRAAVNEVARRPWPADSQVKVISIVEPPVPLAAEPYMGLGVYFEEAEQLMRKEAGKSVEQASAKLSAAGGLQVSTEILTGSPKRMIVEAAEAWGADLIVVGSHGYQSWERMLLGSVSQSVAAHAECSVEIVRCKKAMTGDK
jgi:nucleotide-binding universal stress UspA family protein